MRIYFDTCSLQRPLDNKDQIRVALEAEAVLTLIALVESNRLELISSDALLFETKRVTNTTRREFMLAMLNKAESFASADEATFERAKEIAGHGVMPLDALHLACAEASEADYFCTCDDKLLKKARAICAPPLKVVSPIRLLEEIA